MENCSFCGYRIPPGTGKMYVKKDARILWFCSRRCEKNMLKLGRNPRNMTFTAEAKKAKQQQMAALAHATKETAQADAPTAKAKPAAKERPNEGTKPAAKPKRTARPAAK